MAAITTAGEIANRRRALLAAQQAWNGDDGSDLTRTVQLGENVYFAGILLADALDEVIAALDGVRPSNWNDGDDPPLTAAYRLVDEARAGLR